MDLAPNATGYDFEHFYQTKLQPYLEDLKLQRDSVIKWRFAGIVFLLSAIIFFIIEQVIAGIAFSILIIVSIYYHTRNSENFIENYKQTIINEIINFIQPGLVYKPGKYVSSKEYRASGHYRYIYQNYDGDDYIEGNYKGVSFHCSEIETSYDSYQEVPLRNMHNKTLYIFKGLFFVGIVNRFRGGTYIWTKGDEQLPLSLMDEQYRMFPLPNVHRLRTTSEEFNKYFSVYSTYPAEADLILTDEMLHHIVNFRKQIGREIRLSIVAGKFYVSIPVDENLLEPSGDPGDKEMIKEYFFSILLILSIINQLDLGRLA